MRVLVVDDDEDVRAIVRRSLERECLDVVEASDATEALRVAATPIDVAVLDIGLPGTTGLELLTQLREHQRDLPVIMLTGAGAEADRVLGLMSGADDYVVKPFSGRELAARVMAAGRRRAPLLTETIDNDGLTIDSAGRRASLHGRPLELTAREFDLLHHLTAHAGRAFSRDELLRAVWASSAAWQTAATVTEHVRRLRTKIEADPAHPVRLVTVRGAGYRLETPTGTTPADGPPLPVARTRSASDQIDHAALDDEIRVGLERREFRVHYQPVVDLRNGRWTGVEALLRWQHPRRGLLAPAAFIDRAERSGAIVELGMYVLEETCLQWRRWQQAGTPLEVAVNLSGRQIADPGLVDRIGRAMAGAGMPPGALWLEVTETSLVEDLDHAASVLGRITELGACVSIDDFGTGWASLTYLRQFPVRALKIDRMFVAGLDAGRNDAAIVSSIISLGAELGLSVVAEGIETTEQLEHLKALGCVLGQGYLFSRPQPPCELRIQRG